jgi:iron(III) transport system ATP-binding protein
MIVPDALAVADEAAGASPLLTIRNLSKYYGGSLRGRRSRGRADGAADGRVRALEGVSFDVTPGEFFTLLGPSGCGKTTTLRSIAGLETPDLGEITLGGWTLFDRTRRVNVPTNRRGLGVVFQSYAIWPHLTVYKNVSFPLDVLPRRQRPGRAEISERVERALDVTGLSSFVSRPATNLSGGQQQRLALARAMVTQPALMLLDEPLSNLDAKLRESMRLELKRLQTELGITTILVTHDQSEALGVSSRIAVMNAGRIEQLATPQDIYRRPASRFVADFVGTSNLIEGVVDSADGTAARVRTSCGEVIVAVPEGHERAVPGAEVLLSIRPESIHLGDHHQAAGPTNSWPAKVVTRAFSGDSVDYLFLVNGIPLQGKASPSVAIEQGSDTFATVAPHEVTLVPVGT